MNPGLRHVVVALVMGWGLWGCGGKDDTRARATESQSSMPPIITEHRFKTEAPKTRKAMGEACEAAGSEECSTGLCLHVASEGPTVIGKGYVCSQGCADARACPAEWSCQQVLPGAAEKLCVPPSGWRAAAARPRSTR